MVHSQHRPGVAALDSRLSEHQLSLAFVDAEHIAFVITLQHCSENILVSVNFQFRAKVDERRFQLLHAQDLLAGAYQIEKAPEQHQG